MSSIVQQYCSRAPNLIKYSHPAMLILITVLLFFVTSLVLVALQIMRPNYRFAWLITVGGALLAWISTLIWQARMPLMLEMPSWGSKDIFSNSPFFLAEGINWPYALALTTLGLAVILTAVVRPNFPGIFSWAGSMALIGFGLLAVLADNPLTLVLIWAGLDLTELMILLVSTDGGTSSQRVVTGFGIRALGISLLLWAGLTSTWNGTSLDFRSPSPEAGVFMLIAAGLRLGVLPLHLAYDPESNVRRESGTVLRLVAAASSLVILARIPAEGIASPLAPFLLVLAALAGLYGGWMWIRSTDELTGRPYWILSLASLAVASALRGNPAGSVAWGVVLILAGGTLFFSSVQNKILQRILLIGGLWGISSLPFSPTAAVWANAAGETWSVVVSWPILIAAQALLAAGFIRHTIRFSRAAPLDANLAWARNIYPVGIGLPLATLILLGILGWDGTLDLGTLPALLAAVVLTLIVLWLVPRVRWLNPIRVSTSGSRAAGTGRLDGLTHFLAGLYISFGRLTQAVADALEGDGGILWALLFVVLILSLIAPRVP